MPTKGKGSEDYHAGFLRIHEQRDCRRSGAAAPGRKQNSHRSIEKKINKKVLLNVGISEICYIFEYQNSNTKPSHMKTLKFKTALKQIQQGKIECVTDLKIGYVEIFNLSSRKRNFIEIV
jgi:hypothetical protein